MSLKEYIKSELWELCDMAIEAEFHEGPKIKRDVIDEKERRLLEIVEESGIEYDNPDFSQASFIISNARRYEGD